MVSSALIYDAVVRNNYLRSLVDKSYSGIWRAKRVSDYQQVGNAGDVIGKDSVIRAIEIVSRDHGIANRKRIRIKPVTTVNRCVLRYDRAVESSAGCGNSDSTIMDGAI